MVCMSVIVYINAIMPRYSNLSAWHRVSLQALDVFTCKGGSVCSFCETISSVGKNSYVRHTCVIICVNTVLANPKFSWGNKLLTSSTPKLASTCQCTACAYIRITAASGGLKGLGWRTPIFLQVERSASVPMWSTSRPQSLSSHAAAAFAFARTVSVLVRLLL
jgi:hypothetical protein